MSRWVRSAAPSLVNATMPLSADGQVQLPVPPSIFGSPHPWLRLSTAVKTFHRQSELRLSYRTARTVPSESLDNRARWLIASAYDATAIEVDQLLPPSLDQLARRDRLAPELCKALLSRIATNAPSPSAMTLGCRSATFVAALTFSGVDQLPESARTAARICRLSGSVPLGASPAAGVCPVQSGSGSNRSSSRPQSPGLGSRPQPGETTTPESGESAHHLRPPGWWSFRWLTG